MDKLVRPGSLLIVESTTGDGELLTALVEGVPDARTIRADLGRSGRLSMLPSRVRIGVYTPQAYLQAEADAVDGTGDGRVLVLTVGDVEHMERRPARAAAQLSAGLFGFGVDGAAIGVLGETLDVSAGGCRLRAEAGAVFLDPVAVMLRTADGEPVVATAVVREHAVRRNGVEYRLAFVDVGAAAADRLAALL